MALSSVLVVGNGAPVLAGEGVSGNQIETGVEIEADLLEEIGYAERVSSGEAEYDSGIDSEGDAEVTFAMAGLPTAMTYTRIAVTGDSDMDDTDDSMDSDTGDTGNSDFGDVFKESPTIYGTANGQTAPKATVIGYDSNGVAGIVGERQRSECRCRR